MFFFSDINDPLLHHLSFSPMRYQLCRVNKDYFYFFTEKDDRLENIFIDFHMKELEKDKLYSVDKCEHIFLFEVVDDMAVRRHIYDFFKNYEFQSVFEEIRLYRAIESVYDKDDVNFLVNYQKEHPTISSILGHLSLEKLD